MLAQIITLAICNGSIYALMTIGLTLIFGVLNIVNFAHGEFLMLSLFSAYWLTTLSGMSPYVSLLIVVPVFFLLGVLIERLLIRPIIDKPFVAQICSTKGLSLIMMNASLIAWGPSVRTVRANFAKSVIQFKNIYIPTTHIVSFIIALVALGLLFYLLQKTYVGKAIRAVSQNAISAQLAGVNTKQIYGLAFGIGIACTAGAGVIMSPIYATTFAIGQTFSSLAFLIVVFGGVRSLTGTVVAAFIMALVEALASFYWTIHIKDAVMYAVLLIILLVRPTGLFGSKRG
ncbi:MAG: branched-chain amino acid ABC transporter permease [Firmicutes bacterium]|nr:branched-chain amino acid ABC transporter permease [Bacillota bacterium]